MDINTEANFNAITPDERVSGSYNYLSPTSFRVIVPKMPKFTYFVQSISVPSINISSMEIPAYKGLPRQEVPSNLDISDDLIINFVVDENMENWQEVYDWMTEIVPSSENNAEVNFKEELYSPIIILIYNSAKKLKKKITFNECYPISLSSVEFNSSVSDIDPLTMSASFEYSDLKVETF